MLEGKLRKEMATGEMKQFIHPCFTFILFQVLFLSFFVVRAASTYLLFIHEVKIKIKAKEVEFC